MSGSSLDGIDLAYTVFTVEGDNIDFELKHAESIEIDKEWIAKLRGVGEQDAKTFFKTHILFGHYLGAVISDFDNDGFKDLYIANVGDNSFYKNLNGNKFIDQTELLQANVKGYSTGLTAADFDNDRNIDLYVSNYIGSTSTILKNNSKRRKIVNTIFR